MLQTYSETWVHQKRRMRRTWMCWTVRTMPRDYRRRWWMTTCHDNKPWMTWNRMTTWPWMLSHLAARTSWNHRAVSLYYYTSHELMYQQTTWNDVRCLTKIRKFTLPNNIQLHLGQSENYFFLYHWLSALAVFDVRSFPPILSGIRRHFKFCWYIYYITI